MGILSFAKKMVGKDETKKSSKNAAAKKDAAQNTAAQDEATPAPVVPTAIAIIPSLTEKAVSLQMHSNTYAFRVTPNATKGEIKQAIKARYNVTPTAIRTSQRAPKARRRGQTVGASNAWKRAYVTLPDGKKIDYTV